MLCDGHVTSCLACCRSVSFGSVNWALARTHHNVHVMHGNGFVAVCSICLQRQLFDSLEKSFLLSYNNNMHVHAASDVYCSAPLAVRSIMINPSVCVCVPVCVCVCLPTSISLEPLDRSSQNFVYRSPVDMAQSSSAGVVLHYVLPVLWITSRLVVVGCMALAALRHWSGV